MSEPAAPGAPVPGYRAFISYSRHDGRIAASALRSAVARLAGDVAPRLEGVSSDAVDIAFSPRAARLAVLSRDGAVSVLDAATGRLRARWVPADVDLREPVTQPPGPACRALIGRLLIPTRG